MDDSSLKPDSLIYIKSYFPIKGYFNEFKLPTCYIPEKFSIDYIS